MIKTLLKEEGLREKILFVIFGALALWWGFLFFIKGGASTHENLVWGAFYQLPAIAGGVWGLFIAKKWGGFKSVMGRSVLFFSIGLLLQAFGQTVFSYFNLISQVEVPYPSLADIGFFGSIPFYILGAINLGHASGFSISLKSFSNKIISLLIPGAMLVLSYYFFLKGYEFGATSTLQVLLDFGYPLGQAIYVSVALLTYILVKNTLGGLMRRKVWIILVALVIQYVADYNFLSQAANGTWVNGGYGDFIYLLAYVVLAYGILQLGSVFYADKTTVVQ